MLMFDMQTSTLISIDGDPVELRAQSAEVLRCLAARRGQLVTKADLIDAVWTGKIVSDDSISQCIADIRRALGPNGKSVLRTIHRKGFRLDALEDGPLRVMDAQATTPVTPERSFRPTIAVLPLTARAEGSDVQDLINLICDEIIRTLSGSELLNVISRLSSQTFGIEDGLDRIVSALGADHVLSGSVIDGGESVQIVFELSSTANGHVLWSERIDELKQTLIHEQGPMKQIAYAVHRAIITDEVRKAGSFMLPDLPSHTLLLGAIDLTYRATRTRNATAEALFKALLERAPHNPRALAAMGVWYRERAYRGWSDTPGPDIDQAVALSERALEYDPDSAAALTSLGGGAVLKHRDYAFADQCLSDALAANPNNAEARLLRVGLRVANGTQPDYRAELDRALGVVPNHPYQFAHLHLAATTHLAAGDCETCLKLSKKSLRLNRSFPATLRVHMIAQHRLGLHEAAQRTAAELIRVAPSTSIAEWRRSALLAGTRLGSGWEDTMREVGLPA